MRTRSDEELLIAAAHGDQAAFAALISRLAPAVTGAVAAVTRDPDHAIAHEVFVDLWRTAPRYDTRRGPVAVWALTAAHRRAVDEVRARRTRLEGERGADFAHRGRSRESLETLPRPQREAVALAFFEARTCAEIATILRVPLNQAVSLLRSGLLRLRDQMASAPSR